MANLTYAQVQALEAAYKNGEAGVYEGSRNRTMLALQRAGLVEDRGQMRLCGEVRWVVTPLGKERTQVMCDNRDPLCLTFYSGALSKCPKCGKGNKHQPTKGEGEKR